MSDVAVSFHPSRKGEAIVDIQSPLHLVLGFAAGILGVDPHLAVMAFVGARIVEQSLRAGVKDALLEREQGQSLGNEMADLGFEMIGLYYGEHLRERLTAEPEPAAGLGVDYYDPRTFRYDDFMSYGRRISHPKGNQ